MSKSESLTRAERRIRAGQTVRVVVWIVVLAAVVVFAAVNRDKVNVDWVVDETNAPLSLVIGASALAGALFGYLAKPSRR